MTRRFKPPLPPLPRPPDPVGILYAVIGRSEDEPILYYMNLPWVRADQLRLRCEAALGRPCFVVPMSAWHTDPLAALRRAERERFDANGSG